MLNSLFLVRFAAIVREIGRRRSWGLLVAGLLGTLTVTARAADAPAAGNATRPGVARPQLYDIPFPTGQQSRAATTLTVTYTGNPPTLPRTGAYVIKNIHVQGVYVGPSFNSSNASTVTNLEKYLQYIVGSSFMTSLAPYGVSTGTASAGKVLPVTVPHYSSSNRTYLTDTQIQNLLVANLASLIKPGSNTLYVVYTEPGVAIDAGGGSTSINTFLGYHNYATYKANGVTSHFAYAVMPYPGSPNPSAASQGYASAFDELTSVTSHEIAEAATDPDTMNGWWETVVETDTYKNSAGKVIAQRVYQDTGEEIGDVPLILYNYSSSCFIRLNGYLIQKMIGPDGVHMLTPAGAASVSGTPAQAAGALLQVADQPLQQIGIQLP